ncbi:hypothetical protein, partial [Cloacibacillus porcorum]|uniref:hypothetical protein n=1 Tax=Cloacibacillus porcorum TaxID=1197717 RepID=UPI003F106561
YYNPGALFGCPIFGMLFIAGSSLREGAKIFGKSLFISFPTRRKSVLKIHMTAGKSVRRSAVG